MITDTDRINWLIENSDYFPKGYNGCKVNRHDFFLPSEFPNLRDAIDHEIEKEKLCP